MASKARPLVVLTLDLIFYLTPYAHLRQSLSGFRYMYYYVLRLLYLYPHIAPTSASVSSFPSLSSAAPRCLACLGMAEAVRAAGDYARPRETGGVAGLFNDGAHTLVPVIPKTSPILSNLRIRKQQASDSFCSAGTRERWGWGRGGDGLGAALTAFSHTRLAATR